MAKTIIDTYSTTQVVSNPPVRNLAALSVAATISVNSASSASSAAPYRPSGAAASAVSHC